MARQVSRARQAKQASREDRRIAKAHEADVWDFAGQRSLGQMTREARRELLFGG